ncbi:MAG: GTPase HflX, partial [Clostridium sp.]
MQQVVIVLADTTEQTEKNEEFIELIQAADMEIRKTFIQNLKSITLKTYIGIGKCEEIRKYVQEQKPERIVFNHDLSPLQIRNLEVILQTPVMDRTELILAIFESRAV